MPNRTLPLDDEGMYHLYNRATGSEPLFQNDIQYRHFLQRLEKYVLPQAHIWSYCLMPNHYHLLIEIKEHTNGFAVSKSISDCCNAYTKWLNTITTRQGTLFMRPFKRNKIQDDAQLAWTIWYIHRNPLHHHYASHLTDWKYSSYKALSSAATKIAREKVLQFFGSYDAYLRFHTQQATGYYDTLESP